MSLFRYIGSEVTRSYMLEHDQERYTSKREKMYTFMRIPRYEDNVYLLLDINTHVAESWKSSCPMASSIVLTPSCSSTPSSPSE